MKKIIIALLLLTTIFSAPAFAQDDTQQVKGMLDSLETERLKKLEDQLVLTLPEVSDNPNFIVTFKDPSGKGVQLAIDGQAAAEIKSPYTLPSLEIGKHILLFKFTDDTETAQQLEKTFVVIPRVPVINPPEIKDGNIIVTGTAMPNSEVSIILTSGKTNIAVTVISDDKGNWENRFADQNTPGTYTVLGITKRKGYASNYSDPTVFTIESGDSTDITDVKTLGAISFKFADINFSNPASILEIFKKNTDLAILLGGAILLGILIGILAMIIKEKTNQDKTKKVFQNMFKKEEKVIAPVTPQPVAEMKEEEPKKEGDTATTPAQPATTTIEKPMTFKEKFEMLRKSQEAGIPNEPKDPEEPKKISISDDKAEKEVELPEVKEQEPEPKVEEPVVEEQPQPEIEAKDVNIDDVVEEIKPSKTEKQAQKLQTLTKEAFLKQYKSYDPDNEKGVELKNKVKISLTSKD